MSTTEAIPVRLTPTQASLVWPGLDLIVKAYISHRDGKTVRYSYPFRLYPLPPGVGRGTFDSGMMDQIISLWKRLRPRSKRGGRIQMNAIEVRVAMFAVRTHVGLWRRRKYDGRLWSLQTKAQIGIDDTSLNRLQMNSARVIRSLERHMKRANRLLLRLVPQDAYAALMDVWHAHLRWMRLRLVYFKPLRPVLVGRRLRFQRDLDELVAMAERGIVNEGFQPPDAKELRRMMRLFARASRRHPGRYWEVASLLVHKSKFTPKWYLARFVLGRLDLDRLPER